MEVPMLKSLVFSLLFSLSLTSYAEIDSNHYSIGSVDIKEVEQIESFSQPRNNKGVATDLGEVIGVIDSLIAIGKKIYPIVEAGKPVLSSDLPVTHVLPQVDDGTSDYELTLGMMENWKYPKSRSYKITYKNFYGIEVISFTFTVHFQYGGSYEGAGKYLTGVFVSATELYVSWGFEFSAKTEVVSVTNLGTNLNPVAGLTLKLDWAAKSIVTEFNSSKVFHITGNGNIR